MVGCQVKAGTRAVSRRQRKSRVVRAVEVRKTLVRVTVLQMGKVEIGTVRVEVRDSMRRTGKAPMFGIVLAKLIEPGPYQTPAAGGRVGAVNVAVVKVLARVVGSAVEAIHRVAENLGKVVPFQILQHIQPTLRGEHFPKGVIQNRLMNIPGKPWIKPFPFPPDRVSISDGAGSPPSLSQSRDGCH